MAKNLLALVLLSLLYSSSYALNFATAFHCEGKTGSWCLQGVFTPGHLVSFLDHKDCSSVTGQTRRISTEESEFQGTELKAFSCPDAKGQQEVVLDLKVRSFHRLKTHPISADAISKKLDRGIRARSDFKKLLARSPDQNGLPPPVLELHIQEIERPLGRAKAYVVTYTNEGEMPYLISGNTIMPLASMGGLAIGDYVGAFELNGTEFVSVNLCELGTDACGMTYTPLGK